MGMRLPGMDLRLGVAAALAASTLALLPSAAPAAEDTVRINPSTLPRGPEVTVPHLVGSTVIDGDRRVEVDADHVELLGKTGSAYVVATGEDGGEDTVQRLTADGSLTPLVSGPTAWATRLSDDGRLLVTASARRSRTRLVVRDASTGTVLRQQRLRGSVEVVAARGDTLLLSSWTAFRTWSYDVDTGERERLLAFPAGTADLAADRISYFTADPYDGGCMVVTRVSDPTVRLWRSCEARVEAFSPNGRRLATVHLLSDGPGPSVVDVRSARGRVLASYESYVFGEIFWETNRALVLGANTRKQWALVRCEEGVCERASDLTSTQVPRLTARQGGGSGPLS